MNRIYSISAAALLAAAMIAGCAQQPAAPKVDVAAEAAAITARSAAWNEMYMKKDAASIAGTIFTSDAVIFSSEDKIIRGAEAIRADLESNFTNNPDGVVSWSTTKVVVAASGELAYETGTWNYDPDGAGAKPAMGGEYVTVWSKADGTWRAAADAGANNPPAEAAPAA